MTLMQNGAAGSFRYTVEGETGLLGDLWQVKPLAVAQEKPEEYAKICASIPYPGMAKLYFPTAGEITDRFGVAMDETAMEIARLLARVGKMERDAALRGAGTVAPLPELRLEYSRLLHRFGGGKL